MFHKPKRWTECMKVKLHIHETDASQHWTLNEFVGIHCLFNGIIASSSKWLKLRVRIHEPYKIQFNWFFVGLNYSSIRSEVECFLIHFVVVVIHMFREFSWSNFDCNEMFYHAYSMRWNILLQLNPEEWIISPMATITEYGFVD